MLPADMRYQSNFIYKIKRDLIMCSKLYNTFMDAIQRKVYDISTKI